MKTKKFYIVIFCLGILISPVMNAQKMSTELPEEASSDWYKMATENILKKEYDFSKTSNPDTYRTVNQKNHLGFIVSPDGFSVYNLKNSSEQRSWNIDFTVAGAGRIGTQCSLPASFTIGNWRTSTIG